MRELTEGDAHLVFSALAQQASLYSWDGEHLWRFPMGDAAVGGEGFGFEARCPPGEYVLGASEERHEVSEGYWFTPLVDLPDCRAMEEAGRSAIGIHGGGTGLEWPYEAEQPLERTRGCLRVRNEDNATLAEWNNRLRAAGGHIYFTKGH